MTTAPNDPGIYEWRADTQTWIALSPFEVLANGSLSPLTVDLGQVSPTAPTPPYGLALRSKTTTTVTVTWGEDDDPTIGGHKLYANNIQNGGNISAGALSGTLSGLSPSTTYAITVTRYNLQGLESDPSNILSVTTDAVVANVPTAPSTFSVSNVTDTGASASWTETSDSSVTGHQLYLDGVKYGRALSATALSTSITGLTARTSHSAYVTRSNSTGESSPSPSASFTTTGSGGGGVQHDVAMGVSNSKYDHKLSQWPAMRVYAFSQVQGVVDQYGCRVIGLTDSKYTSATPVSALNDFLTKFYGWSDSTGPTKNLNVEIHWGNGNEVDGDGAGYSSGSLPQGYIDAYKAAYNIVHAVDSKGNRKYPKASVWVDMTQNNIRNSGSGPRFKAIAPYLDGMACSMYPPGRKSHPTRWDAYSLYCGTGSGTDEPLGVVIDWFNSFPNCKGFATWEIGSPIDHPTDWISVDNQPGGEPTAQTDITIRPRYFTGGRDASGNNWKGFLQYVYDILDAAGVEMHEQIYWDSQTQPPNQLFHDTNRTTKDTASAWHDWTPGTRLADG